MTLEWSDLTKAENTKSRLAFHELGHAVAATLHGGHVTGAVIKEPPHFAASGETVVTGADARRAEILYAGPWCETRFLAGGRPTTRQLFDALGGTGCRDDAELSLLGGTTAGVGVEPMLERCWDAVVTLAVELHRAGTIRHTDVLGALGLTKDTAAMGLAAIRSGATPGGFTVTPAAA